MRQFVLLSMAVFFVSISHAAEIPVPGFDAWKLTGPGKPIEQTVLEVVGKDQATSAWHSPSVKLEPGGYYRYSVSMRGVDVQGGCLPCGLEGFSRDYGGQKNQWTDQSFCFRLQENRSETSLRVGQWESNGVFQFKNIKLETVTPVSKEFATPFGVLVLGEGESLRDGEYRFNGWFGGSGTNVHRPLSYSNATFNSYRWCFGNGSRVDYRFRLLPVQGDKTSGPIPFDGGKVKLSVCYHASGEGAVEISRDGETRWTEIGRIKQAGTFESVLPPIAFPMEQIYLRIRGLENSNFQVESIALEAPLVEKFHDFETKNLKAHGETIFAGSTGQAPDEIVLTADDKIRVREFIDEKTPPKEHLFPLEKSASPKEIEQKFKVGDREYSLTTSTHPLHRSDYGHHISQLDGLSAWWCEADWKVSKTRPAPKENTARPIHVCVAKNEVEGFQFVVRAPDAQPIKRLSVAVSELTNKDGKTIPAENIEILYAYYHFVHSKTDGTGLVDYWPDALPPLDKPIDVEAGKNQPIWVNVKIPDEAAPGSYVGMLGVDIEGSRRLSVPFTVYVWDFALPKENHHETAYGFNPWQTANYHNAKTDEDRRRVVDMYLRCFADHRISIYNPTPFDGMEVKWLPNDEEPEKSRCEIDFSRYEKEMERVLDQFHFTNFTVPGHGLGGGTFHGRTPPSIGEYGADAPQYRAMMTDYYTKLLEFLKRKNWLDKAYVYWFDEPNEKDYEFVASGNARLGKYAPGLAKMMTVMLSDDKLMSTLDNFETSFDIWCPVSHHFQEDLARKRMKLGERFWWYVCTGPKAPYCTLFIDHPATELRVWHWQAWQRGIVGSLIWESTYWHSGAAFPNGFQNPYEDPMGYMSGYSTPQGTKINWGNGDGRFIYPPLTAAVPGLNEGKPNFDKPVSSIRWEMIRDGVEDWEMLYMLRDLLKQKGEKLSQTERTEIEKLLDVPESVSKSMTEFTIDPRPMLEHRKKIGDAIEKLAGR